MSQHNTADGTEQATLNGLDGRFPNIPADDRNHIAEESRRLAPLATAADVGRNGYTNVEFDDKICCILREYARKRSPNRRSIDRHLVGVAGELAVASWLGVPIDTRITDDYEGDRGYDLQYPRRSRLPARIEVKTTRRQDPEATINRHRIDNADWFVLCRASRGADRVDIIGYARRSIVKEFGDMYGNSGYTLVPEYLHVTEGEYITPNEVRDVYHQYRR